MCVDAYASVNDVAATIDPSDPAAVDVVVSDFLPAVQDLQDQLDAVTPSEALADQYAEVLAAQQENLDSVNADPASLFALDGSPIDAQFDAMGLTSCGSGSAG